MKTIKCPHCGDNLLKSGVGIECTAIYIDNPEVTKEFGISKPNKYFCPYCGTELDKKLGEKVQKELKDEL